MLRSPATLLRRAAAGAAAAAPSVVLPSVAVPAMDIQPARCMGANLDQLKGRIKATTNVAKVTGVMKMVAASKIAKAEENANKSKGFGDAVVSALAIDDDDVVKPEGRALKRIVMMVTTDRGLCGSVNGGVIRQVKTEVSKYQAAGEDVRLAAIGEKGKSQFKQYGELPIAAYSEITDFDPNYSLAAAIAQELVKEEFDVLTIYYNYFVNTMACEVRSMSFPQMADNPVGQLPSAFAGWDVEPENHEETLIDLQEFAIAGGVYYCLLQNFASEQGQRMVAMDGATTNAEEMVRKFTLEYNRTRQAKITTELSEIVSGAEALEDQ